MRFAIVDTSAGKVINVVIYDAAPPSPPPGFGPKIIAVQSDQASMDWTWNGAALVAPPAPPPVVVPQMVLAQDLVAQFTTADMTPIQNAVASTPGMALLWYSLMAQRDPMLVTNARFQAGWSALVQVLGQPRMSAIASALGLTL